MSCSHTGSVAVSGPLPPLRFDCLPHLTVSTDPPPPVNRVFIPQRGWVKTDESGTQPGGFILPKSFNDFPDHGLPSEFEERVAEGVGEKKRMTAHYIQDVPQRHSLIRKKKGKKKKQARYQLRSHSEAGKGRRYINFNFNFNFIRPNYIQVRQSTKCLPRQTLYF